MKKLFCLLISLLFITPVYANTLEKITMDIYLDKQGNGHITEVWYMNNTAYTEVYKPYYNLGNSTISNFTVKDNISTYEFTNFWNTEGSFADKAYKNGFNRTSESIELCWGISKYGLNTYTLEYDISNMIIKTSDGYNVFYWTLIPHKMNPSAMEYDITVRTDTYLPDTIDVWGFGAYGKYAYVSDGVVKFVGEEQLKTNESVVGLVKFPEEMFNPTYSDDRSFNDFLSLAKKGSTPYKEKSKVLQNILAFLFQAVIWVGIILATIKSMKYSGNRKYLRGLTYTDSNKKLPKDIPMFRDIPCQKNIFAANFINFAYGISSSDKGFIGCIVLKWLKEGIINIDNTTKDQKIILNSSFSAESLTGYEKKLYNIFLAASNEWILKTDDFKSYCRKHYSEVLGLSGDAYLQGRNDCINLTYLTKSDVKGNSYIVNQSFYDEGLKIAGLKKFLIEFSDMKNKETIEVKLWEDYLIFAQMFGIAKKVAKQLKDLYPEVYEQMNYDYVTFTFINDFTTSGYSAASAARSAAQSYSSGGGGFSSGGGGGGSFGGGGGGGGCR